MYMLYQNNMQYWCYALADFQFTKYEYYSLAKNVISDKYGI